MSGAASDYVAQRVAGMRAAGHHTAADAAERTWASAQNNGRNGSAVAGPSNAPAASPVSSVTTYHTAGAVAVASQAKLPFLGCKLERNLADSLDRQARGKQRRAERLNAADMHCIL